jgi:hypothetical protein
MPAKQKSCIVVIFGDRNGWGFDEITLPPLVALIDSASPDYRKLLASRGVAGYFLATAAAAQRAERVVAAADELRIKDRRFESLAIGVRVER